MLRNGRLWMSQEGLWGSLWYCSLLVLVSAICHKKRKPRHFFFKRLLLLLLLVAIDSETKTGFTFHRQQPRLRQNIRNNRFQSLGTGPQLTVIAERWETHELMPWKPASSVSRLSTGRQNPRRVWKAPRVEEVELRVWGHHGSYSLQDDVPERKQLHKGSPMSILRTDPCMDVRKPLKLEKASPED